MKGTISRVIDTKGFGFIRAEGNVEYFFHRSAVKNATFNDNLIGYTCEFEPTSGPKGLRAEDVYLD